MKRMACFLLVLLLYLLSKDGIAQTNPEIQGTWRVISTRILNAKGEEIVVMDSSTHNLTKVITPSRVMFTIYNLRTDSLTVSGQGKAVTNGSQYTEIFEQSTSKGLLRQPMVFTYKVEGNRLSYKGGSNDLQITEVLKRIE